MTDCLPSLTAYKLADEIRRLADWDYALLTAPSLHRADGIIVSK